MVDITCHYQSLPDTKFCNAVLKKNGSTLGFYQVFNNTGGAAHTHCSYTTIAKLAANDYIQPFVYHNGGVTLEVYYGGNYTHFAVGKLF